MFTKDRDLLVLEPGLFRDVSWAGQRVLETTGVLSGTRLTISGGDARDAGIGAGHVVMVNGAALEVVSRLSGTELEVSKLRRSEEDDPIPAGDVSGAAVVVTSFLAQIEIVERQILAMAGIESGGNAGLGLASVGEVVDSSGVRRAAALGALYLVFTGAASVSAPGSAMSERAEGYRLRWIAERARVVVSLDLDGDGRVDAVRRLSVSRLTRG